MKKEKKKLAGHIGWANRAIASRAQERNTRPDLMGYKEVLAGLGPIRPVLMGRCGCRYVLITSSRFGFWSLYSKSMHYIFLQDCRELKRNL